MQFNQIYEYLPSFERCQQGGPFKSCISLNKRFWAKSFFGNLKVSFGSINMKIEIWNIWGWRVMGIFYFIDRVCFLEKIEVWNPSFLLTFLLRKSFKTLVHIEKDFLNKKVSKNDAFQTSIFSRKQTRSTK